MDDTVGRRRCSRDQAELDPSRLRATCTELGDPTTVILELDLHCVGLDGTEGIVADGAKLVFDLDWQDPTDSSAGVPDLDIVLRLNVDIYALELAARRST